MSTRESGSDTWPRFAEFPGDNLDLGNAPEEVDVDHGSEPPSWRSGAAAVGTGADPPDLDQETAADHDDVYPADAGAAGDAAEAPGFGDLPGDAPFAGAGFAEEPGFADERGYEGGPADDQGFDAPAASPGFGDAPAAGPGFGTAPETEAFGAAAPSGFGGQAAPSTAFENPDFDSSGYGAGYNGQPGDYAGHYQGEFAGYGGTYPAASAAYGGPAAGVGYVGEADHETVGRDHAPPYPGEYPPAERPRRRLSLQAVRRGRSAKRSPTGRQAQLTVSRVEPWSVMKFSFVISLVAFIVLFVAVAVLYGVLSGLGVFSALQRTIESITSSQSSSGFNLSSYLSASRVLGYTGLLGAVNVVLITAISTVGSVLYNVTADLAGGVEVTLKETD